MLFNQRKILLNDYINSDHEMVRNELIKKIKKKSNEMDNHKMELENLILSSGYKIKNPESDYVFISFILDFLPVGLIGFLIAVIFSAAMSSTSAEITALSSITTIDIYKRLINENLKEVNYINLSKLFSLLWGMISILFALTLITSENLIESINIVASLFYGNILGIFSVSPPPVICAMPFMSILSFKIADTWFV